ncbi:hypothetical protein BU16DRAFT_34174 [Lophium mytilinum]|uniref:Uncharacterized protein n=1 Tax=Lophium mytilinum TaxID=390894 RepID=A0A6A6RIE6_9PEZI|nr:hypothetical protein BU16DRAFT_34174 [Lophium mytilinum]
MFTYSLSESNSISLPRRTNRVSIAALVLSLSALDGARLLSPVSSQEWTESHLRRRLRAAGVARVVEMAAGVPRRPLLDRLRDGSQPDIRTRPSALPRPHQSLQSTSDLHLEPVTSRPAVQP